MTALQLHDPTDWNTEIAKQVWTICFNFIFKEFSNHNVILLQLFTKGNQVVMQGNTRNYMPEKKA